MTRGTGPASRAARAWRTVLLVAALLAAVALARVAIGLPQGLRAAYFRSADWTGGPRRTGVEVPSTAALRKAWDGRPPATFSAAWAGSLLAPVDRDYTLASASDDGSWVWIDGDLIVENPGIHPEALASGRVHLARGAHRIDVRFFQGGGLSSMALLWSRDGRPLTPIPAWALTPGRPRTSVFVGSALVRFAFVGLVWALALTLGVALVRTPWTVLIPEHGVRDAGVRPLSRTDAAWAAGAAAIALAVYVRTLAPGLTNDFDTPLFQFLGRVLGVGHNPGYPLYALITYPFSYVPIGSLAYRMNLFSALMGAATVGLVFAIARQLGCRRLVALCGAMGAAFGVAFWSQSVIAEVYTLNAAIVAGMLAALLAWSQNRRAASFYLAAGLLGLGLAHHTDIVGFLPGMAAFALLVDRRSVARWRTLAGVAACLAGGLSLYLFIVIRSHQPGSYVESPASNLEELASVVLARQFGARLFAFSPSTVVFDRVPELVTGVLVPEVTVPALVLAVVGALFLGRRSPGQAVLLLGGAAVLTAFVLNYDVGDAPVFLIPVFLIVWVLAAVGAEYGVTVLERWNRIAGVCLAAACMLLPAWSVRRNFAGNDRSGDIELSAYFDRLFDVLPSHSFLVTQDFVTDRMVRYKLLGERAAGDREVEFAPPGDDNARVRERAAEGYAVFAFQGTAAALARDGYAFTPFVASPDAPEEFHSAAPGGLAVFRLVGTPTPEAAAPLP